MNQQRPENHSLYLKHLFFAFSVLCFSRECFAQIPAYEDTTVKNKIQSIINQYEAKLNKTPENKLYAKVLAQAEEVQSKLAFVQGAIKISYYGGEKGDANAKNDLVIPALVAKDRIAEEVKDPGKSLEDTSHGPLSNAIAVLDQLYQTQIKNKDRGKEIEGDDDENRLVQVEVKVLSGYGSKVEVPEFAVYCDNPFVLDSREDFNPTTYAIKKIEAGYRCIHIKKGKISRQRMVKIVYSDPNTHLVIFYASGSLK